MSDILIDARELKEILENKSDFSVWIKRNINNNQLKENEDFFLKKEKN